MNNPFDNYFIQNTYTTNAFSILFEDLTDKIISNLLPVRYEYQLDKSELLSSSTKLKQYPFLESTILPNLKQIIKSHHSFLEIEALQLKSKHDISLSHSQINLYTDQGLILLNEKAFAALRHKVLLLFFTNAINASSSSKHQPNNPLLDLSSFISYHLISSSSDNSSEAYAFNINLSFDNFIFLMSKVNKKDQLEFWFCFFIPMLSISIETIEYDYYFTNTSEINSNEFKWQMISIYYEYIDFTQKFIQANKSICTEVIVTMTNNLYWIEEITERLNADASFAYIKTLQLQIYSRLTLTSKMSQCIAFDHLVLNFYGRYSAVKWSEFVQVCLKVNKVRILLVNLFEFNHFEYLKLVKMQPEQMAEAEKNATDLLLSLSAMIKGINKASIEVIALQVKKFTSYKSYLKSIITEFNALIKEVIDSGINFIISFSNIIETVPSEELIAPRLISDKVRAGRNDLTFANPSLFIDCFKCMGRVRKLQQQSAKKITFFHLSLFEKDIKIMLNKTIDYSYFRTFKTSMISNLTLAYFTEMNDLITFLRKIQLNTLVHLIKAKFYLKTNKGFVYHNLSSLFSLNWPKTSLKSIKFIFESSFAFHNFDVFSLYEEILLKKYFIQEASIPRAQSLINQLPSANDVSFISQFIVQGNNSMLMDMTMNHSLDPSSSQSFLYPLQFVGFMQIETYLQYRLNVKTMSRIVQGVNRSRAFDKSLNKKKLKDKFLSSVVVSEYPDVKANCALLGALMKFDRKHKTRIAEKLKEKIIINHFPSKRIIFQLIFSFIKGRRCVMNDFKNSYKVFEKYSEMIGKRLD